MDRRIVGSPSISGPNVAGNTPLVTSAAALFALTFALIEGSRFGWGSPTIMLLFAGAVVGLVVFVLVERYQRAPMLDLALFRNATFAGANVVALLVTLAMFGVFFFMSLYLQQVLGYSPVRAGAIFLPMTVLIILVAPVAGKLSDRIGARWLMAGGMTLVAGSLLLFSRLGLESGFWDLFPGLVIGGLGMAITMTPMTAAALSSVPVAKAGVASGVLNTSRQLGGAIGIAMMGAILTSRSTAALTAGASGPEAFLDGFSVALEVGAAVALVAALVAGVTVRDERYAQIAEPAEAAA